MTMMMMMIEEYDIFISTDLFISIKLELIKYILFLYYKELMLDLLLLVGPIQYFVNFLFIHQNFHYFFNNNNFAILIKKKIKFNKDKSTATM